MGKINRAAGLFLALLMILLTLQGLAQEQPGVLNIRIFKVGKADAFLLRTANHAVLIDAGEEDDAQEIMEYLVEKGIDALDLLILTHFDKRNIGGAPELLQSFGVNKVMLPGYQRDGALMNLLLLVLDNQTAQTVTEQTSFEFDGVSFTLYPALQLQYLEDQDNDFSLVVSVTHGENSFLFSGDIMSERIEEMIQNNLLAPHTVIKMPCHGQNIEGLDKLLDAVSPEIAIIPASLKNPPAGAMLLNLEHRGIRWYSPMYGSITLTSDGYQVTVKQNIRQ